MTAYRWFREGKLPVPARRVGRLILVEQSRDTARADDVVAVYARVSAADQRRDLDRQVARVTAWTTGQGIAVSRVVTEVGSALDGRRKKFLALLHDPAVTTIVVERRDRFARFGPSMSRPLWQRRDGGYWSSTRRRWTTIWCGMSPRF